MEEEGQFARVYGSAGQTARSAGLSRIVLILSLLLLLSGYVLGISFPLLQPSPTVSGLILLGLAGLLVGSMNAAARRMNSYVKGALGEERVGVELARLPAEYHVFHGVTGDGGRSDLDHVVVGPTGVVVIETKNWSGRVSIRDGRIDLNGRAPTRPPLEQVKQGVSFVKRSLSEVCGLEIPVVPVICFVSSELEDGIQGVEGVRVCGPGSLATVIMDPLDGVSGNPPDPRIAEWLRSRVAGR